MTRKSPKPALHPEMSAAEYSAYYWMKADLVRFARQLGLSTHGHKPELSARIHRRLRGLPEASKPRPQLKGSRDSDQPLRRSTPVVKYMSDDKTRAFFKSEIGPDFHFTYHLNQYRLANANLTYGDLIEEWVAERERRRNPNYRAPLAEYGKYNRFIRDFFADRRNKGRSLREAAAAWNKVKNKRGDPRYSTSAERSRGQRDG